MGLIDAVKGMVVNAVFFGFMGYALLPPILAHFSVDVSQFVAHVTAFASSLSPQLVVWVAAAVGVTIIGSKVL